ncbi:hypothetical protein DTO280E4_1126 [Paecilomyces variotii]|nr:hypothetical protein DTO280E4_1126 [Paecilomyces variotii]
MHISQITISNAICVVLLELPHKDLCEWWKDENRKVVVVVVVVVSGNNPPKLPVCMLVHQVFKSRKEFKMSTCGTRTSASFEDDVSG